MKLMHLKSGTDVRGVAVATEKYPEIQLTDEVVKAISGSFIEFLCEFLYSLVIWILFRKLPVKSCLVIPFVILSEFLSHKQQFLSWMSHHIG